MADEHVFTVVLDRLPDVDPPSVHATFGMDEGLPVADFVVTADTLGVALANAIRDIEARGSMALRIVDEDLVTQADIAHRVGLSREAIRRYATGDRGPGGFPPPAAPGRRGAAFYRWTEVSAWFKVHTGKETDAERYASTLAYANLLLQARNLRGTAGGDPLLRLIAEGLS